MDDTVFGNRTQLLLGLYNTKVAQKYLAFLAPTIHYTCGSVLKMPVIETQDYKKTIIEDCISITKIDWDSFENSWDFNRVVNTRISVVLALFRCFYMIFCYDSLFFAIFLLTNVIS